MLVAVEDVTAKGEYDYVICGGGTAGLCLAARLTEDPKVSVLVLEAGEANLGDAAILRPASFGSHFGQTAYDWGHKTVPQKHCGGSEFAWNRGKGLGGSSAINFLCWTKPPASDIDDLERLGNPGWNWETYMKYNRRNEGFVYPTSDVQKLHNMQLGIAHSGEKGPLMTAFPAKIIAAELDVQQTMMNVGISLARDPLNGDPKGFYFTPNTLDPETHTRTYAASAYYQPNAARPNYNVLVSALVHKAVTHKGADGLLTASGIEFSVGGKPFTIKAKKEVIFAAGGLKTPQLLEQSGIGMRSVLSKLNIPVQVELPVGENVQEHFFGGVTWELKDDVSFDTLDVLRDEKVAAEHLELHKRGEGIYTMGITGFSFTPLGMLSPRAEEINKAAKERVTKEAASYPPGLKEQYDIQVQRLENGAPSCELITVPGFFTGPNPPKPNKKYMSILTALNHTFSRGSIHSVSTNPKDDPAFDPNYFAHDIDLQTMIEMIKFIRRLATVEPLKSMIVSEVNPGPELTDDAQIIEWAKKCISSTWHTAGSASMMPKDKGGVVDSNLKVYGTSNIRVVDLSVIPLHFAAHPQATVYVVAERAADIIKGKA